MFPHLREYLDDPLTEKQKGIIMALEVVQIEKYVQHLNKLWTGQPSEDRCYLARIIVTKAVYNLDNTRILIDLLHNYAYLTEDMRIRAKKRYPLGIYLLPFLFRNLPQKPSKIFPYADFLLPPLLSIHESQVAIPMMKITSEKLIAMT